MYLETFYFWNFLCLILFLFFFFFNYIIEEFINKVIKKHKIVNLTIILKLNMATENKINVMNKNI